jgi:hypothetical protein
MFAHLAVATLLVFAATSIASAQRQLPRGKDGLFFPEKMSTRPVQPREPAPTGPASSEAAQKARWEARSRPPAGGAQ